jgi:peptidoglycan/LPS O-acetylase OafA/YrhL
MTNSTYHKEIDGLRAISVLVIILFHLKVNFFQGGFVGVDVFFVVSGYLITQIISSNLHSGHFSFKDFYIRRSTRILPALVVTVLVTLLAAIYLQQPQALIHTARQSVWALLSVSNFFFWSQASYWDVSAERYLLLHTWSLGVEEQFYLVYPLLLFASHRIAGRKGIVVLLLLMFFVSVIASEIVISSDRTAAFFSTPLRFFEFAVGGLGAFVFSRCQPLRESPWLAATTTLVGLSFILLASAVFNPHFFRLPGIATLLPVSGALLIILAGASPSARILLMNPLMSWLGKRSYSLYLVHWPIIVFYRYYYGSHMGMLEYGVLVLCIALAAELLNRTVETRFRLVGGGSVTATGTTAQSVLLGILASTIVICILCALIMAHKGWPARMPEAALPLLKIEPEKDMRERKEFYREQCLPQGEIFCGERQPGKKNILLLGDSRVLDIYIALRTAYPDANVQASYAMGCAAVFSPNLSFSIFFPECPQFNQSRLKTALEAPSEDVIFLAQDSQEWRSPGVLETVKRLREAGKTVYVLGQFTITEDRNPIEIAIDSLRFHQQSPQLDRFLVENPFHFDGSFADEINAMGAVYISNKDFFYDGQYHLTDRVSGELLTYDGFHLNMFGARCFGQYLQEKYPVLAPPK